MLATKMTSLEKLFEREKSAMVKSLMSAKKGKNKKLKSFLERLVRVEEYKIRAVL